MIDLRLQTLCNHRVMEFLTIEGESPNYYADLEYTSNKSVAVTSIYEFSRYDGITLFSAQRSLTEGVTNFSFSEDGTRIYFGTLFPVDLGMDFPDPNPDYIPEKKYLCTYVALLDNCPKCLQTKRVWDVNFDTSGRLETLEGSDKVRQQVLKALLTVKSANLMNNQYGSGLSDYIGSRIDGFLAARIHHTIIEAINLLIDEQATNSDLPDSEKVVSINNVEASQDPNEPRTINVIVTVTTADYQNTSTGVAISI